MSMADALLQERQKRDAKKREKILDLAQLLESCIYDVEITMYDMEESLKEGIKYLREYARGGHLK